MQMQHFKKLAALIIVLVTLSACNKNKVKCNSESEKVYSATGFNKIVANDNFNVTITKGNAFSVKAQGCTENIQDVSIAVSTGGTLNIRYSTTNVVHDKALNILVTMPALEKLDASAAAKAVVVGMDNQPSFMRIVLSGAAECTVNNSAIETTFNLSGASKLMISGNTDILVGQLDGASRLNAYTLASKRTEITASGASKAYVTAQNKLSVEASGASEVRYKGNPPVIFIETSGNAKIIKE